MKDHSMLKELDITILGKMLVILKLVKEPTPQSLANYTKTPKFAKIY